MTPAKIIGTFNLGGAAWTVLLDSEVEEQQRYQIDLSACTISLTNSFNGKLFTFQVIEKNLWEAILYMVVNNTMYYGEIFTRPIYITFSSLFYQAISTLLLDNWEGTFQVGGIEYYVTVDNERCHKEDRFGCCYAYQKKIVLTDESPTKQSLPEGFIYQTLYHEMFHSIAREMGMEDTELNSERFVNVLSYFVHEIRQSLVINFPEQ